MFSYKVVGGVTPDISGSSAKIELYHTANLLPNINVTLRVLEGGIVNAKWTWAKNSTG